MKNRQESLHNQIQSEPASCHECKESISMTALDTNLLRQQPMSLSSEDTSHLSVKPSGGRLNAHSVVLPRGPALTMHNSHNVRRTLATVGGKSFLSPTFRQPPTLAGLPLDESVLRRMSSSSDALQQYHKVLHLPPPPSLSAGHTETGCVSSDGHHSDSTSLHLYCRHLLQTRGNNCKPTSRPAEDDMPFTSKTNCTKAIKKRFTLVVVRHPVALLLVILLLCAVPLVLMTALATPYTHLESSNNSQPESLFRIKMGKLCLEEAAILSEQLSTYKQISMSWKNVSGPGVKSNDWLSKEIMQKLCQVSMQRKWHGYTVLDLPTVLAQWIGMDNCSMLNESHMSQASQCEEEVLQCVNMKCNSTESTIPTGCSLKSTEDRRYLLLLYLFILPRGVYGDEVRTFISHEPTSEERRRPEMVAVVSLGITACLAVTWWSTFLLTLLVTHALVLLSCVTALSAARLGIWSSAWSWEWPLALGLMLLYLYNLTVTMHLAWIWTRARKRTISHEGTFAKVVSDTLSLGTANALTLGLSIAGVSGLLAGLQPGRDGALLALVAVALVTHALLTSLVLPLVMVFRERWRTSEWRAQCCHGSSSSSSSVQDPLGEANGSRCNAHMSASHTTSSLHCCTVAKSRCQMTLGFTETVRRRRDVSWVRYVASAVIAARFFIVGLFVMLVLIVIIAGPVLLAYTTPTVRMDGDTPLKVTFLWKSHNNATAHNHTALQTWSRQFARQWVPTSPYLLLSAPCSSSSKPWYSCETSPDSPSCSYHLHLPSSHSHDAIVLMYHMERWFHKVKMASLLEQSEMQFEDESTGTHSGIPPWLNVAWSLSWPPLLVHGAVFSLQCVLTWKLALALLTLVLACSCSWIVGLLWTFMSISPGVEPQPLLVFLMSAVVALHLLPVAMAFATERFATKRRFTLVKQVLRGFSSVWLVLPLAETLAVLAITGLVKVASSVESSSGLSHLTRATLMAIFGGWIVSFLVLPAWLAVWDARVRIFLTPVASRVKVYCCCWRRTISRERTRMDKTRYSSGEWEAEMCSSCRGVPSTVLAVHEDNSSAILAITSAAAAAAAASSSTHGTAL